jgi:hypothetical protein
LFLIIVIATTKNLLDVKHRHVVFDNSNSNNEKPARCKTQTCCFR